MWAQRFNKTILGFYKACITTITVLSYIVVRGKYYPEVRFWFKGEFVLIFLYAFLFLTFATIFHTYRIGQQRIRECLVSYGLSVVFSGFIQYLCMSLVALRPLNPLPLLCMIIGQCLLAIVLFLYGNLLYNHLCPPMPMLFISNGSVQEGRLEEKFRKTSRRYYVGETIDESVGLQKIIDQLASFPALLVGDISLDLREQLLSYCFETDRVVILLASMKDIIFHGGVFRVVDDTPVYFCKRGSFIYDYRAKKRTFDIVLSALLIALLSPLVLISMLAILLEDGRPVFFRQTRLTRDGKKFLLTKLRSMVKDAEKNGEPVLAQQDDQRITKVGKILRKYHIDELPQLLSIFLGEMTFVGPRPERPEMYEIICKEFPEFSYRLKVKAGLTGYAQLYGKYNTPFEDKVRLDVYYIENASLRMDISLMIYTLKKVFFSS